MRRLPRAVAACPTLLARLPTGVHGPPAPPNHAGHRPQIATMRAAAAVCLVALVALAAPAAAQLPPSVAELLNNAVRLSSGFLRQ